MMRVLILGADGYVGHHLVQVLAASDWAEPVPAGRRASSGGGIPSLRLDAERRVDVEQALNGVDAVVNCVSGGAATIVRNAEALFGAAAATGKHVIYLSSIAVYGSTVGSVREDSPMLGDVGAYSAAKVRAEQLAAGAANVTIFRPGCIYGFGSPQWTERIAHLLMARRIGDLGAAGSGCSNLVHLADVLAAILAALRQGGSGVRTFNLSMPDAPEWNDYFRLLAEAIGGTPVARVPGWRLQLEGKVLALPLRVTDRLAARIAAGTHVPPAIPPSLIRLWGQKMRVESDKASAEFGLSWTGLEAGVAGATVDFPLASNWRPA